MFENYTDKQRIDNIISFLEVIGQKNSRILACRTNRLHVVG